MAGILKVLSRIIPYVTRGGTDTEIRVSTESLRWRRTFSCCSCRDLNPRTFNHESGALTTELSRSSRWHMCYGKNATNCDTYCFVKLFHNCGTVVAPSSDVFSVVLFNQWMDLFTKANTKSALITTCITHCINLCWCSLWHPHCGYKGCCTNVMLSLSNHKIIRQLTSHLSLFCLFHRLAYQQSPDSLLTSCLPLLLTSLHPI